MSFVTAVLAEAPHTLVEIAMPPILYGLVSITVFAALGFVLWSYRSVANRHAPAARAHAPHPGHDVNAAQIER